MKPYIGTKIVAAELMSVAEAEKFLGRPIDLSKHEGETEGYVVVYPDGYKSFSPKSVFEAAYRSVVGMNFGHAIEALRAGQCLRRRGWNGKGMFVCKQIPSTFEGMIISKFQNLPQSAKDIVLSREGVPKISYVNQMLIVHPDGRADSWVPSVSDVFAEDWEVVSE